MSIHQSRAGRINCLLIAGGVWHDIDHARLELLKLLSEDDRFRVRVFEDYENLEALEEADFIVSYTCNVVPSLGAQEALSLGRTRRSLVCTAWHQFHYPTYVERPLWHPGLGTIICRNTWLNVPLPSTYRSLHSVCGRS